MMGFNGQCSNTLRAPHLCLCPCGQLCSADQTSGAAVFGQLFSFFTGLLSAAPPHSVTGPLLPQYSPQCHAICSLFVLNFPSSNPSRSLLSTPAASALGKFAWGRGLWSLVRATRREAVASHASALHVPNPSACSACGELSLPLSGTREGV